jgi:ferritin-like metal-binding protein YciE
MPIVSLRDLYIDELHDLLTAEQLTLAELPNMAAASTSSALRELFEEHLAHTRIHADRLELLLRKLDALRDGTRCEAMEGLVREGRRRIRECERGDVLDAALIAIAQRIEHYEIAAYGCARAYAHTLGDRDAADLLQQTLDEEGGLDARLTRIAQREINIGAAEDVRHDAGEQRARLRYLPVATLRDFKYRDFHIRNADDDLGRLDGLVVDARSNRPVYFVVDSGGWFAGQRFLVPIDALRVDRDSRALRTDLDRKTIETYPQFDPGAFAGPHSSGSAATPPADEYRPPSWLMTGVWMTEASGFASVPPRAQSDFTANGDVPPAAQTYPENERMVARGEPEERGDEALDEQRRRRRDS